MGTSKKNKIARFRLGVWGAAVLGPYKGMRRATVTS
jgi:hypothetical protein